MKIPRGRYLIALALTVLVALGLGGLQLLGHVRDQAHLREMDTARAALAGLSWPEPFTRSSGDRICSPTPDSLCLLTPDQPQAAAARMAKLLGVDPAAVHRGPATGSVPPHLSFWTRVAGVPTLVSVSPTLAPAKPPAKNRIAVTGSSASMGLVG